MKFFDTVITDDAKRRVQKCLDSGFISEGKLVKEFEQAIEREFGYKNCVAVNSGTSALHLALVLAGVKEGDEVILPAQTFVATGLAVLYCGAKPVFANIERDTGNISPSDVFSKINERTKAVIGVAWGGNPVWVSVLETLCRDFNLFFIQDNAQALGATFLGKPLTEYGDFSCYSFQAIKHLTTGDGGILSCRGVVDEYVAKKLRWFGISKKYDKADETGERNYNIERRYGYKYHMNDISAALGLGNLQGFTIRQKIRNKIAKTYDEKLPKEIQTRREDGSANWLYDILVDNRKDFMRMMREKDIPVSVVHVGIDRNDIFGGFQDLPNQRYWDKHHVCLPIHPNLSEEDVSRVVEAVNHGW